jgi:hypothetical protein
MMKKISLLIALFFTTLLLVGCGEPKEKNIEGTLDEILTKIYADIKKDELPKLETINVLERAEDMTDEDYSYRIQSFIGSDKIKYKEVLASEPNMSSIAYSVVLVRMEKDADIEKAKTEIKENVNPRKWFCVGVEKEDVIVKNKGDLIILIMVADEATRTKIEAGFDAL